MENYSSLERDLSDMKAYFGTGKTKEASWRQSQLKALHKFLLENEDQIFKALNQDLGKPQVEAFRDEVGTLIKTLNFVTKSLKQWMAGKEAKLPRIAVLSSAEIVAEPLGLVLIFSSWNFPLGLSLEPLIGAVAAGNSVVLKPSEMSPACSSLLANVLPSYLDSNAIKIIQGGPTLGELLLKQRWDKIFFTGSARVGRIVMSAAAEHLTPVSLELGGKCPALLDSLATTWDREMPLLKDGIKKMFGENPRESKSIARIVNKQHFLRLKSLINSDPKVKESVVLGGSFDEDNLFIEPTILVDPPLESAIMTDEIFGPLLPIITVEKIEDSVKFINSRAKPLAIYAFTKNKSLQKRMVAETSSGSLVFNDAIVQYIADTLPFGGVGESGFGKYHGKFSFDIFSHHKAVARRSYYTDFWYRFPPWTLKKLQLLEVSYNLDYIGILLVLLGLRRSNRKFIN
ncbi:aldehyde dehydrogenase family 3 member F1-like isoform X2 [Arachis stenosperma]|uniref:aldehyde dehydrogenase family 3 member F1-like isoform X2 n=1 Tax=Arachis stenosperma TaxID=217475 RepID=UPI0025AC6175|nr:aldehyde dehydrogenase family 3 member F1-like isoform X2 [Arachis stenosperma]